MVRRDSSYLRSQRLQQISKKIAAGLAEGNISLDRFVNWIQINIGLTEVRAQEYIDICVKAHTGWMVQNGFIKQDKTSETDS